MREISEVNFPGECEDANAGCRITSLCVDVMATSPWLTHTSTQTDRQILTCCTVYNNLRQLS